MGTLEELPSHELENWHHLILLAEAVNSKVAVGGASGAVGGTVLVAQRMDIGSEQLMRQELDDVQTTVSRLEARFVEMNQSVASQPPPLSQQDFAPIETRIGKVEQTAAEVLQSNVSRDEEIALLKRRVQELDLRSQFMESSGYDGMLLWKIGVFTQRLRDAKEVRVTSLYSPPFYAGRYGYKLCARCYLNGDGIGRGTHISLFFVVMQGDYDDILVWPFSARVTLALIDQSGNGKHHSETFRPDTRSSSFRKPISPMNVASGCPTFISHELLLRVPGDDGQIYIQNDTLYFRISVDMSEVRTV